ncbi:putative endo xylanase [Macrophomina phaseolina]|uniref:Endo xylanase n=1 Tax=Macrophomina phaseolina TaxID=35725 RepID=A0ABQ8G8H3_9PEZI|nr:putative endo xylanase [Macrophomina phaseolina]
MLCYPCALLSIATAVAASSTPKLALNSVIRSDFPDPSLLQDGDMWYSFGTNQNRDIHVQIATSPDFDTWAVISGKDALPNLPGWVNPSDPAVWAPDVIKNDDGKYVLYFSAAKIDAARHCIGVATSDNVEGPYTAQDEPWVCHLEQGGTIDASSFRDSDGSRYVTYKIDGNSLNTRDGSCGGARPYNPTPIMLQQVSANGIDKIGDPIVLLDREEPDGPLIEAPSIAKLPDGRYVLFFSSNCWQFDYDLSYALADSVRGPYTKSGPLFTSTGSGLDNPGGASIAADGIHLVFHAFVAEKTRGVYSTSVAFNGDEVTTG